MKCPFCPRHYETWHSMYYLHGGAHPQMDEFLKKSPYRMTYADFLKARERGEIH